MAFTPPPVESYIEEQQQPQARPQFVPPPPESFQPDPEDFSRVPIPDVGALRVPGTVPLEQRFNQTPNLRDGNLTELPPEGVVSKARRVLAPLIGAPNGEIMSGPAASDVDRRGFVRAILSPEKKTFPRLTAEDVATGNVKALLPGNLNAAGENPESFYNSTPGYEAPTWAKIAAGAQRAVAGTADVVANPMLTAGFAMTAGAPLLSRAASATFGVQMLKDLPEITHSFNEAAKAGDVQGATEALVGAGLGTYFGIRAIQHAGGPGIAKESPMVRRLLSKQITETFTPEQLKDISRRIDADDAEIRAMSEDGRARKPDVPVATPAERELVQFIKDSLSYSKAIRGGVKVTQSEAAMESQFWRDYLGLEKGSKGISLLTGKRVNVSPNAKNIPEEQAAREWKQITEGEQNANRKQSAVPEAGSDQAKSVQTVSARAPGNVRQITGASGGQAIEAPRPFTPPAPVEVPQEAPKLRTFNPGPTMEFARQIADMTGPEYMANAQSFNKYNIPLGKTVTPAEVEELKKLLGVVEKRRLDLMNALESKQAKGEPLTDQDHNDFAAISMMPQFFNEAIIEASKRPSVIEKSDEKRLPTNTVLDPSGGFPVHEIDVDPTTLELSRDVPQFKEGAGAGGEVQGQELKGEYTRVGTGRTVVWERLNGNREIVTGRHKWQLALRNKLKDFPVQIVREADGFTKEMAFTLDAESNIRDNQGSVRDYAHYFRQTAKSERSYSKEDAVARGLLRDAKGRNGWDIGRNASDDLYSIWRAEKVSDGQAVAIARAAPGNADLQALGIKQALAGSTPEQLVNFLKAVSVATQGKADQIDMFGNNDAALNTAVEIGKKAAARQREIYDEIRAVQGAAKNPTVAARHGVDVKDPQGVLKRIAALKVELEQWENWELHPELIAQLTAGESKGVNDNGKENEKGKKQEVLKPKTGSPEKSGGQSKPKPKKTNETITDTSGRFESEGGVAKAAANHLRESIGTDKRSIAGAEASSRQAGILAEWATTNGLMVDVEALAKLPKLSDDTHEHHVALDEKNNLVIKQTWPGSFGNGPVKSDTGIWREHLTPLQYLERVELQNKVFGDTTKVIGFAYYPDRFMRRPGGLSIVTSQHFVQIGDEKNPTPSQKEIDKFMESRGFESIPGEVPLWRRASDGVLVMDARADNFIKTQSGAIIPIDLQIGREPKLVIKLKPGQNTADLIDATQKDTLSLAGEKGTDVEKQAAAKAKAAQDAAEAKRIQDEQQQRLFDPSAKPIISDGHADALRKRIQDRIKKNQGDSGKQGSLPAKPSKIKKTDEQIADEQRQFSDSVQLGAYYITKGMYKFPEWSTQMRSDFGDSIEPQLKSIYETAKITIESPSGEGAKGRAAGLQPGLKPPTERIVTARSEFTKRADESIIPTEIAKHLDDHQRQGAASALVSTNSRGAFLLADGTGAGKTRQAIAVADYYAKLGKKVVIVTKAETIKPDWKKNTFGGSYAFDSKAMGVKVSIARDGVVSPGHIGITTYQNLAAVENASDSNTVLIFDESHALKNDSQQARHGMRAVAKADKVMYMSATPADKPEHIYYLAPIGVMEGKTVQQALRDLGMTLVTVKKWIKENGRMVQREITYWTEDQTVTDSERHRRFSSLFDRMTSNGSVLKREISMDGVHVQVLKLSLPPEAHEAMADILSFFDASSIEDLKGLKKAQVLGHQRRQQEPFKVASTVMLAKRELDAGRQVVIFVSRVNESEVGKWVTMDGPMGKDRFRQVLMSSEGTVKTLVEALREAGIHDIAEIHGNADQASLDAMADYQAGRKRVVVATIESGGTGINLDDTVGNRPRSMIVVTAPFDAVGNVQAAGRIWRLKTLSSSSVYYLFGDTEVDDWNADIIGTKMSMLGAVVEGQVRRLNMSDPDLVGTDDFHSSVAATPEKKEVAASGSVPVLDWKPFKTKAGKDKFIAPATKEFWDWYNANGKGDNPLGLRPSKWQGEWQVWADSIPSEAGQASLPSQITPVGQPQPPVQAKTLPDLRALVNSPATGLSKEAVTLINAFLDSPLADTLEGLTVKIQDVVETGWDGSYFQGVVELARNADPKAGVHEFLHRAWEVLPADIKAEFERMRVESLKDLAKEAGEDATRIQQIEDLITNPTTGTADFLARGLPRDLYEFSRAEELFTHSGSDQFKAKVGSIKEGFWARVKDFIKDFIAAIKKAFRFKQSQEDWLRNILNGNFKITPESGTAYEKRQASIGKPDPIVEAERARSDVGLNLTDLEMPKEIARLAEEQAREGVPTETFNVVNFVAGRQRLDDAFRQAGQRFTQQVFAEIGIPVRSGPSDLFLMADPANPDPVAWTKMIERLKKELAEQRVEGRADATGGLVNYLDSLILMWQTQRQAFELMPPEIGRQLFQFAQGERSFRGLLLGAMAHLDNSVSFVGQNVDTLLQRVWSDQFNGAVVTKVLDRVLTEFKDFFTDEELRQVTADAPDLTKLVDEIIQRTKDANPADKVYQRASAWLKPKKPKGIRALQADARVKEAVEWILDAATKAGVVPTKPVSKKMTPQEQLLHLLTPGVAPQIQASIEKAFVEMEWDAALSASKPDDRPAMIEARDAGADPDPELVAKGLALPKFAKWVATRDFVENNLLGYNPVTLKLVQDLVTSEFAGSKFGKPVAKPADTRIDLRKLAKSPDDEVRRVLDAYLADIEANMQMKGAPPELRQRIKRMIYAQVRDQIASRREEFINSFISPKKSLPLSASIKLRQLINAGISKDFRFQSDKVRQLIKKIAGEYTKDVPFESLATSTRAEKQQWLERKADEIGIAEKFSQHDEDTRAQLEATVWTYLAERLQAAEDGITRQFLRGNDVNYEKEQLTPEQRQASLDAAKSKIEGLVRAGAFDTSMVEAIGGKSSLAKLTPGLGELVKQALATPFYRQSELGEQFADKLVSEFSIDEAQRDKAKAAFNRAFANKFKTARAKAAEKAYESLTPQEKKAMPPRSPIWRKIERVVNADADFSTGETLKQIARDNGWEVPSDEQIALVKDMSEQIQRLRELTPEEAAAITDPALRQQAEAVKAAATQERRVALKRQIETYWARWTQPITLKSQMGRANAVAASYEFSAANLLFRLGFMSRQGIDVFTQIIMHIPSRSIGNAIVQHGGFWKNTGNVEFWRDASSLLKQAIGQQIEAVRPALREFREALRGTAEAKNVDRLMSGIALFERLDQKAGELDAAGKHGQAFAMRLFGMVKFSYRFASALDNLQGVPQEWQEMRTQAFRTFRNNGMTTAEAKVATDTIIGDLKAEHLRARSLARQYLDATGKGPSKSELDAAAWHIVKALAYQRMRDAGMPADDFEERNRMMRSTNAWNEGMASVNSVGGVAANLAKRVGELGKSAAKASPVLMPIAAIASSFGRFGNAMGTAIDRSLTYSPLGLFPSAFGVNEQHIDPETGTAGRGSPWYRTREDRAQRAVESSIGTAFGALVTALVLGAFLIVRNSWPKDKEKRDLWDRMGWKPGTVALQLGNGEEIVMSMTVGPMAMVRPYLAGAGALRDALDAKAEKQAKLNAEAEKLGLPPGQVKPLDLADMFSIAGNTMWASVMGGRTASGLVGSLTDYGTFNPSKTTAATVSPLIPGLPAVQEASRMAGVSLDANLATFADFLVPMPTSGARRVNLLGDPSGTPSDMQRIVQILTGGTYPGITSSEATKSQAGYSALFQTGYRPPSINPNKAYAFDGAYRPMKDEELSKYTQLRGQYLKEELSNLGDNPDERSARAAYQTANSRALSEMGVQVQTRRAAQSESQPASSRGVPTPSSNASVAAPRFARVSAGRGRIAPIRKLRSPLRSSQRIRPLRPLKLKRQKYAAVRRVRVPRFA